MQLISREAWGARPPRNQTRLDRAAQLGTAVHYSASDADEQADHANCARRVRAIQDFHMDGRGWADIAYSYLACKHGFVYEGRGRGVRTAAQGTDSGNDAYHAVCFLGDDTADRDDVTDAGREAIRDAVLHCNAWSAATEVRPHSWFKATACPGDDLHGWIKRGMPVTVPLLPEEIDMPNTEAELVAAARKALVTAPSLDIQGGSLFSKVADTQGGVDRIEPDLNRKLDQLAAQVADLKAVVEAGPTPVPITVDAAAVVAELVGSRLFLDAVATTVADELARRGAE